jgi:uncharacterized protein (TIGR03435 family)
MEVYTMTLRKQVLFALAILMVLSSPFQATGMQLPSGPDPDRVLFERSMNDLKESRFTAARLTLQTLINTYPDSEYLERARFAFAESFYKEGTPSSRLREVRERLSVVESFTATSGAGLQFEAASLRLFDLAKSDLSRNGAPPPLRCRGIDGELFGGPGTSRLSLQPLGRCTGTFFPSQLIRMAYASDSGQFEIMRLPDEFDIGTQWMYQIEAVAPEPSRATKAELQEMLRTLLRDRFKLKTHHEMREVDGFQLMVAKGGIKFKETSLDEEPIGTSAAPQSGTPEPGITRLMVKGRYGMKQFSQGALPGFLEGRPVIDKTGLPGVYDMTFLIDMIMTGGAERGGGALQPGPPRPATPLTNALEEQLGLRLERGKVPVEFLIIDHIEKPMEN